MYNKVLLMHSHYGYNPEYENLSEEEKTYMDYVEECLRDDNIEFSDACTKIMLFILELTSKMNTEEELTNEEVIFRKEELLSRFSEKDKNRLESFMYACIETMGIYSEERVMERQLKKKGNDKNGKDK